MGRFSLNRHNCTNILHLSHQTSIRMSMHFRMSMHLRISMRLRINTHYNKHTFREGVVETLEEEEEDLVEEEVHLHAITLDNWAIMLDISKSQQIHVDIAKRRTIMWSNVLSWLQSGKLGESQVLTLCKIQILTLMLRWLLLSRGSKHCHRNTRMCHDKSWPGYTRRTTATAAIGVTRSAQ